MPLNLTIDQGNTATKLAVWRDNTLLSQCVRMRFTARDVVALWPEMDFDAAIYCTVSRRPPTLMQALRRRAKVAIEFSVSTPMPLGIDYRTPATLGLDRLAGAVGAWSLPGNAGNELLVVDTGTAITFDRVTDEGRYAGGNIAPGIFMRLKALNHYTARLPLADHRTGAAIPVWGTDTATALRAGAVRGVVAELEYYRSLLPSTAKVILTGGDAPLLQPLISFPATVEPNLVPYGLNKIIEYNYK